VTQLLSDTALGDTALGDTASEWHSISNTVTAQYLRLSTLKAKVSICDSWNLVKPLRAFLVASLAKTGGAKTGQKKCAAEYGRYDRY